VFRAVKDRSLTALTALNAFRRPSGFTDACDLLHPPLPRERPPHPAADSTRCTRTKADPDRRHTAGRPTYCALTASHQHQHQHNTSSPPNGARRYDGPCRRNRQRNSGAVLRGATKQATRCGSSPFLFPIYWLVDLGAGELAPMHLGLVRFSRGGSSNLAGSAKSPGEHPSGCDIQ
jgi:hypothetical protein